VLSRDSDYGDYSRSRLSAEKDSAGVFEEFIVMIVVIAIATAIRLWKLGEWSFWADEIFTVQDAQKFPGVFNINPIIYMIIRAVTNTLGLSEYSARLGPCIIGILSVPALYWAAKRIFGARVAMVACLFLVVHPWHVFWSQNVRAYSLAFFFSSLSAGFFYAALERDRIELMFTALIMTILAILSYFHTILLLPALAGYVLLTLFLPVDFPRGLNGKNLLVFFGPFILASLLLFSPSIRGYVYSGWGHNELSRSPVYILFTLVYCLGIPIAVAAFMGGIHSIIYLDRGGLFLICYAIIPLGALLVLSSFLNVAGYYLFFTTPAYLILAAFCASELVRGAVRRSKILSVVVVLIIVIASANQLYMYFNMENGERPKWREAFQALETRIEFDDLLVISMPRIADYYFWRSEEKGSATSDASKRTLQLKDVIARLGTLEDEWKWKNQNVWFVLDQLSMDVWDQDRRFRDWLYANCRLIREFPVYARTKDRTISLWRLEHAGGFDERFAF
jgi:hypothetical protein